MRVVQQLYDNLMAHQLEVLQPKVFIATYGQLSQYLQPKVFQIAQLFDESMAYKEIKGFR